MADVEALDAPGQVAEAQEGLQPLQHRLAEAGGLELALQGQPGVLLGHGQEVHLLALLRYLDLGP